VRVAAAADAPAAWQKLGAQEAVLEAFVGFEREVSVVAARGRRRGGTSTSG
jgi:5-(carboxyamino)imidazole ribonucleotide synthase